MATGIGTGIGVGTAVTGITAIGEVKGVLG